MDLTVSVGAMIGAASLLLDLGNRLFGSYARTPTGALWRIFLIVVLVCALVLPVIMSWAASDAEPVRLLVNAAGIVGVIAFVHFLFPYRWGVQRAADVAHGPHGDRIAHGIVSVDASVELPGLPRTADGLTCLVLSDFHCNTRDRLNQIEVAIDSVSNVEHDLVLFLGDFGEDKDILPEVIGHVSRLRGRHGTFCVRGNHDCENGRDAFVADLLSQHSVTLLSNETDSLPELDMVLCGLEHPWVDGPLPDPTSDAFVLGLTHTPDNIVYFERLGIDVGFAGHTHGGRLSLPFVGPLLVPTKLGRFLDHGWFRLGNSLMYITSGIEYFPGRFGNVGEIYRVTLKAAGEQHVA